MSRLTRDETAEPFSGDQILRLERGQGNTYFPCSVDHEQDWQTYLVDSYFLLYVKTIHTYARYGDNNMSLKKNQNAPRLSEHPPVRGGKML